MSNPYQSPISPTAPDDIRSRQRFTVWLLKALTIYLSASIITLPFIGKVWLGEIPPLALFQFPKLNFAHWLLRDVVMPVIRALGLSRGSFSPDYVMARPYGLLLAYLIPGVVILLALCVGRRLHGAVRRWTMILSGVAIVDYVFVMIFGSNGFTIY